MVDMFSRVKTWTSMDKWNDHHPFTCCHSRMFIRVEFKECSCMVTHICFSLALFLFVAPYMVDPPPGNTTDDSESR